MEKLHKDTDGQNKEDYGAFISDLKQFHLNRGTQIKNLPKVNGRDFDLYSLYSHVTALGGWKRVDDTSKWDLVLDKLKLPKGIVNSSVALRYIYIRYLCHYERIHYLGEDPDTFDNSSSDIRTSKHSAIVHQVPMSYNAQQHEVSDSNRALVGLNRKFLQHTKYDKLCASLLSALPNEQDFAINTCIILSNDEGHILLKDKPCLVNLLLAQVGVWPEDDELLREIQLEIWEDLESRNTENFWRECLDHEDSDLMAICPTLWKNKRPRLKLNPEIYHTQELGVKNTAAQKILRIANIFRNLSFEKDNIQVLSKNKAFIRFLIQSIHSNWAGLQHAALDSLGNIASQISLNSEDDPKTKLIIRIIKDGIQSGDRCIILRSLEILAHLCEYENNEDILSVALDYEAVRKMVRLLTVPDMMVLVYTLEALYFLSEMGHSTCDKIVSVYKSIDILIDLLTMDPDSYGPSAKWGMKLVEVMVPAEEIEAEQIKPKTEILTTTTIDSSSNDSESFVCSWLRSNYEIASGYSIARNDLYAEYVNHSSKAGKKAVVNANVFANCVKSVFPHSTIKKMESSVTGMINFHHDGIRKKSLVQSKILTPSSCRPIASSLNKSNLVQPNRAMAATPPKIIKTNTLPLKQTQPSPILKAQLSVPPRPPHPQPVVSTAVGSSPLIKSLLANKVARNIQKQQEVVVNTASGMVVQQLVMPQQPTAVSSPAPPLTSQIQLPKQQLVKALAPKMNGIQDILAQAISQAGIIDEDDPASPDVKSVPPQQQPAQTMVTSNGGGLLARLISEPKPESSNTILQGMLSNDNNNKKVVTMGTTTKMYKSSPLLNGLLDKGKTIEQQNGHNETFIKQEPQQVFLNSSACDKLLNSGKNVGEESITLHQPDGTASVSVPSSDLSSISDITRTLESASKTISKTNIDCNTAATVTLNPQTQTVIRAGQQLLLVSAPSNAGLGQPQIASSAGGTKFWLLYPAPKAEDGSTTGTASLIGFPRVSLSQPMAAKLAPGINVTSGMKRPMMDNQAALQQHILLKKPKMEPGLIQVQGSPQQIVTTANQMVRTVKMAPTPNTPIARDIKPRPLRSTGSPAGAQTIVINESPSPIVEPPTSTSLNIQTPPGQPYVCEWKNCCKSFKSAGAVFYHTSQAHTSEEVDELNCLWENCDNMRRKRLSLLTHIQDWHCTEQVLQHQSVRRQQMLQSGKTTLPPPPQPPPHPGYTPDAAMLAIRRHAQTTAAQDSADEKPKEEALAKSIHLTSALILRNLVIHSALARSYFKQHETELMQLATLPMEFSKTLSQCLFELTRQGD